MEIRLGCLEDDILNEEKELNILFPEILKKVWLTKNPLDLVSGWEFFSIYDPKSPGKTSRLSVSKENESVKDYLSYIEPRREWLAIAYDGYGNNMLLEVKNRMACEDIFIQDRQKIDKVKKSKIKLEKFLTSAIKQREAIIKKVKLNFKRQGKDLSELIIA